MKKIRIAYFGSPDFSANLLEKILLDKNLPIEVKLVVTQPDKKVGRKQILAPTPVKKVAQNFQLPIFNFQLNPNNLNIKNFDLCLLYAYGDFIPKDLLDLPKLGFWSIHPSLLPKYRGTSPMATTLINGDKTTGLTIIKMDEKIDHGPIIAQKKLEIQPYDKRPDLEKKLTGLAFEMFKKLLSGEDNDFFNFSFLKKSTIEPRLIYQNDKLATYTKKLSKQDGYIEISNFKFQISNSPEKLFNLFRGLYPWPGIWTLLPNGKRLKITDMKLSNLKTFKLLKLLKVQLEGKKEVDFETFNKAYKIF